MTVLEKSKPSVHRPARSSFVNELVLVPILLATVASIYASVDSMQERLRMSWSQNPWESAIVADAWRFAHGQPIYERPPGGHATHLYGPLTSPTIGLVFKLFNTSNLYVGRVIVLICALATCAILLRIYAPRRALVWFIGAGLLVALHYRGRAYFVETRPDMIGALWATLALIAFYRAQTLKRLAWYVPGIVCVILALLYKQTYSCVAAVPLLAMLMNGREARWKDFVMTFAPLAALVATIVAIKLFAPNVYFYMFSVPSMYEIGWKTRAPFAIASLFMLSPLFVALIGWFLLDDERRASIEPKMRWLIAALIVGCGAGMLAYAKRGGSYNSLLLGFIPMAAFCVAMIDPVLRRLSDSSSSATARIVGGWLVGLFITISTFCVPNSDLWNHGGSHGAVQYSTVIETIRGLKGRVVIPDDPTLQIAARNEVCRSLEAELDATDRPGTLPPGLYSDVARANWLVRIHGNYDGWFTDQMMSDLGFERIHPKEAGPGVGRMYSLWKRVQPAATQPVEPPRAKRRRPTPPT